MTRVALYARYSSDMQSQSSVEDQLRLCRLHAERQGWTVVQSYHDRAVSGASLIRPGIQALLADALQGQFDIVLAEALDRLSRDQEDVAGIFKRLSFAGVKIVTLSEGEIGHLHVGLKGTMNALFLKDLADKTRRGLRGRIEAGKAGGGLCYGYDVVKQLDAAGEPVRGERTINEAEAQIVRRIFREFATGKSPRAITRDLNAEGIPGPHGGTWMDTTLRGHSSRGSGILNNELYCGRLVWNRLRYVKNPDTGRRVSRLNPKEEWIVKEVPSLRIIADELWEAVRQRQADIARIYDPMLTAQKETRARGFHAARRPSFLLSGLLICGVCGGKYGITAHDRYGCLNRYRRHTCSNGQTISRGQIQERALAGLQEKLVSPAYVAEAVRAYHEETNARNHARRAEGEAARQKLIKIEKAIKGIVSAIEDGLYAPAMKARLMELEQQKTELTARLAEAPADSLDVHPNVADVYRAKVVALAQALEDPATHLEAADAIRALIEEIVLTPGEGRGEIKAVLRGELVAILDFAASRKRPRDPASDIRDGASPQQKKARYHNKIAGFYFEARSYPQVRVSKWVSTG